MNCESRKAAVAAVAEYTIEPSGFTGNECSIEQIYGENVLQLFTLAELLPKATYAKLVNTIRNSEPLDPAIADDVATAMKQWALSKGASHYTHWFQPLTGSTAEKHDSFIEPNGTGGVMMKFSGKNLIVGEPDASSFPSGGLRSTFEARGYTAWDPTSPAFIKRGINGATLCIPTAFCAYTGEALDKKTPLLRSIQAVSRQLNRLVRCFGLPDEKVEVTLGAEQEYFLIDKHLYFCRPDLIQTGRTLFGAPPPKHQQLDDHYFASIKPRVLAFMTEVDQELWRYGIPAKTRHNEVAPAQFEIAPVFEELNLAVDHNMLTMEILRQVAERHNFVCLMHEKPFVGVNGSGKHNNWSISVGNTNLLNPGNNPHQNALFLTTLCAIIQAVDRHGDLLRAVTAGAGNDHRLGANEAPPAIISIFLGDQLTQIIEELENGDANGRSKAKDRLQIGVDVLPTLPRDATDRNRTSPFAYTGGKFEFRAPGSSTSCAGPNIVLNTIVAEAFDEIANQLEHVPKEEFNSHLQAILKEIIVNHKRVIFNGDNYSADWLLEAEKRGLPHARTTPEALRALIQPKSLELFEKYKVLSQPELYSRYEVFMEEYKMRLKIEGELSVSLARTVIFPAIHEQLRLLADEIIKLHDAGLSAACANEAKLAAEQIGALFECAGQACRKLEKALSESESTQIVTCMRELRGFVDRLEKLVNDDLWPLPKYREMLFIY